MCEQCLSLCDFINEPSLEAIQTIICLNIYYNNNDRACAARSLLGVAIRMALTLGLSVRLNHDNPITIVPLTSATARRCESSWRCCDRARGEYDLRNKVNNRLVEGYGGLLFVKMLIPLQQMALLTLSMSGTLRQRALPMWRTMP